MLACLPSIVSKSIITKLILSLKSSSGISLLYNLLFLETNFRWFLFKLTFVLRLEFNILKK